MPDKARHYGIAAQLDEPLQAEKGLALQFELKLSDGLTCGGAYLKYLTSGKFEASGLKDDTPYTIMFGPDKCGSTNKVSCFCPLCVGGLPIQILQDVLLLVLVHMVLNVSLTCSSGLELLSDTHCPLSQVHLILRHKAPSGKIEEKHPKSPPLLNLDKKTHVYTAIISAKDNT